MCHITLPQLVEAFNFDPGDLNFPHAASLYQHLYICIHLT